MRGGEYDEIARTDVQKRSSSFERKRYSADIGAGNLIVFAPRIGIRLV